MKNVHIRLDGVAKMLFLERNTPIEFSNCHFSVDHFIHII